MADKKKMALAVMTSSLALFSGAVQAEEASSAQVQEEALSYSDLGSGEQVRSNLASQTDRSNSANKKTADGSCGYKSGDNSEKPPAQGSCGQSSCGSTGATGSSDTKPPAQGQCGQGSCGSGGATGNTSSNQKAKGKVTTGK